MFAVVLIGGKQYSVSEKDEFSVEKLSLEVGETVKIKEVLLLSDEEGKETKIGTPYVTGAVVECKVLSEEKGEKIKVFKFHSKKRYSRTQGHRQWETHLKVLKISALGSKASSAKEVSEEKVETSEAEVKAPAKKKAVAKKLVKKAE